MSGGWAYNPDNPLIHIDPLAFQKQLWPSEPYQSAAGEQMRGCYFYSKQREIIYAVEDSVETYVKAGNIPQVEEALNRLIDINKY